jgi:hypothetical protein
MHRRHIDDQAIVTNGITSHMMTASSHSNRKVVLSDELERRDNILRIRTLGYEGRMSVDHAVPNLSGPIVPRIRGIDQASLKYLSKAIQCISIDLSWFHIVSFPAI